MTEMKDPCVNVKITGRKIYLRPMREADVTDTYVSWVNDPIINRYLEVRKQTQTKDSMIAYINKHRKGPGSEFFGIFMKSNDAHIGTMMINHDPYNKNTEYGIVIGDARARALGLGCEATVLILEFLFTDPNLIKVHGGAIEGNNEAWQLIESIGLTSEGIRRKHYVLSDGQAQDARFYGLFPQEWSKRKPHFDYILKHFSIENL